MLILVSRDRKLLESLRLFPESYPLSFCQGSLSQENDVHAVASNSAMWETKFSSLISFLICVASKTPAFRFSLGNSEQV